MKKAQIKVFEELLSDKDFQGKKWLDYLLWLNTVKPKFKEGDCFKVTDRGHSVWGHPVRNFSAKVVKINSYLNDKEWRYELEAICECDGKTTTVEIFLGESELQRSVKCKGNTNNLGSKKSEHSESLSVYF